MCHKFCRMENCPLMLCQDISISVPPKCYFLLRTLPLNRVGATLLAVDVLKSVIMHLVSWWRQKREEIVKDKSENTIALGLAVLYTKFAIVSEGVF